MSSVPGTGEPFLRDILYVDLARIRSLLAQLAEGAPEKYTQTEQRYSRWAAAVNVPVGFKVNRGSSSSQEETRVLGDLHLAMFEEAAESVGFLSDISTESSESRNWKRGRLHRLLAEGSLIRLTAPTRVIDPRHVGALFAEMDQVFGGTQAASNSISMSEVKGLIDALYGPGVVVRSFPAGLGEPECHFVGTLLDRPGYIDAERSTLFSRHGFEAQEWTVVAQVARLPASDSRSRLNIGSLDELVRGDRLDRMKIEEFLAQTSAELERVGMAEAPRHPAISIVPLAIYRVVVRREVLPSEQR